MDTGYPTPLHFLTLAQFLSVFGFIEGMDSSVSVNPNMKNPPLSVGVITPPNDHYKPVLYSHVQASRDFQVLNHDLYVSMKNSESIEKRKTPKSVFVALGLGALALCYPLIKKVFKH